MSDKWTPSQQEVIKHSAGNLLVSASAGSGKTSVLIEKIVTLILNGKAHLKNLLVVTFTNSASLEIRQRLQKALSESNNPSLLTELEDLSTSDILTFDSFCIKVVKEFGFEIGKSSNFSVADTSLASFLQNKAIDNLISKYGKSLDKKFTSVIDVFFDGRNDKAFRSGIISLYNFLRSKDNDKIYYEKLNKLISLNKTNEAIDFLNEYILNCKNNLLSKLEFLLECSKNFKDEKVENCLITSIHNLNLLGKDFFSNLLTLQKGIIFNMPQSSSKDIAEIYDIKQEFLKAKNSFLDDINFVITKEIKNLSLLQMENDILATKQRLFNLFSLVNEFAEEYGKLKNDMQVVDFVDIEQYANKILNNKSISTNLQNRYDWIFIDEYQDTSLLQEGIVKKITSGQNLFMVGDFKQSIYRFRQAEPKIFINKYNQYKNMQSMGSIIELKTNFRSDKSILDFNNFVFDKIYKNNIDDFEYKGNADLEFGGTDKGDNEPKVKILIINKDTTEDNYSDIDIEEKDNNELQSMDNYTKINYDSKDEYSTNSIYSVKDSQLTFDQIDDVKNEALLLANEIKKVLNKTYFDAKTQVYKKITFADIAVLSRSKKDVLPKVRSILNQAGIPVTTTFDDYLFKNYDMQILLNIIRTIQNSQNDIALISSLTNIGNLTFDELSSIRQFYRDEEFYYRAVQKYMQEFNNEISQKLEAFFNKIEQYQNKSSYKDICELINMIVENENLDTYFAVNNYGKEFESHLSLLLSNIQSVKDYSLFEFINFIDTFGSELKFENTIKDSENSVTLSTIHKSKGLEYPVVYLIGSGKPFSKKSESERLLMDNDWGICMPSFDLDSHKSYDNLLQKAFKLKIKSENRKESKRLLYVALTRPKNYLTIIGTCNTKSLKCLKTEYDILNASSYLDWIMGCFTDSELTTVQNNKCFVKDLQKDNPICNSKVEVNSISISQLKFNKVNLASVTPEQIKIDDKQFMSILSHKFEHNNIAKKNSVTQILSEEEHYNITNFQYSKNDKTGDDDFLSIGTAYHKYMEHLNFTAEYNKVSEQIATLKEKDIITNSDAILVDESKIIKAITHINSLISNQDIVLKEKQFLAYLPANVLINTDKKNKILVQGVADLIIIKPNEIYLIDYKTSRLKESDFASKYSTQLNIYAKAIESFYNIPVTKKVIYSFYLNKLIII